MAAGLFSMEKASGGVASITVADGVSNTAVVLPESGTVASVDTAVTDKAIARYDSTTGKLQNSAITIDDSGNIGSGTQTFNGFGGSGGFKNKIINGKFKVNQYARLPHIAQPSSVVYIDGNWRASSSGTGTLTVSEDTITYSGTIYSAIKATATTAITLTTDTRYFTFATAIEANNISEISNKDMTLSFIFECSRAGKYSISITKLDSTTGVTQKSYVTSFTATVGVNEVVIPIPADSYQVLKSVNAGVGVQIGFVSNNASIISSTDGWTTGAKYMKSDALSWADTVGAYIKITDVNLEPGLIKTPSENIPYWLELSLCQRYYETGNFHGVSYNSAAVSYQRTQAFYKCNKRISPSVTVSKILGDATNMGVIFGTTSHFACGFASTASSQEWYGTYTASAEL